MDGTLFPGTGGTGEGRDRPSRLLVTLRGAQLAGAEPRQFLARLCRALADAFPIHDVVVHALDTRGGALLGASDASALSPRVEERIAALVAGGLPYVWLPSSGGKTLLVAGCWLPVGNEQPTTSNQRRPFPARPVGVLSLSVRAEEREFLDTLAPALVPFTDLAAAAIARADAGARARQGLAALQELSAVLATHGELGEFLNAACDALLSVTGMDLAEVKLLDPGAGCPPARVVRGTSPALARLWEQFSPSDRLEARVLREREARLYCASEGDGDAGKTARAIGLSGLACVPLWGRDRPLGIISLASARPEHLPADTVDLVRAIGHQLTIAIDHAVLIETGRRQIKEHRERSDELAVLYDLSRTMVATNSLEDRLREVARALARVTGCTHCAIFRREPDGLAPWMPLDDPPGEHASRTAPDLLPEDVKRLVSRSSRGPFVTRAGGRDPFARSGWLAEQGIDAALWLPLNVDRRIIGFALCYRPGQAPAFTPEQRRLAGAVASQAAMAIRMSQAYEHQRQIADHLQSGIRPTHVNRHGRFEIESAYHPALQEARVGGDFYDVFPLPDGRVALLMADVSGKGLKAAAQTGMLKSMLRLIAFEGSDPAQALTRLNRALYHYTDQELFVTAFYGVLSPDTGELRYANAGHDPPLFYRAGPRFCPALDTTGMALGMDVDSRYFSRRIDLERGDLLLLYTDGITEARRGEAFFGRERLEDLLVRFADSRPTRIVRFLYREARAFAGGALHDDVALLCLKARE